MTEITENILLLLLKGIRIQTITNDTKSRRYPPTSPVGKLQRI